MLLRLARRISYEAVNAKMVAVQEELDWACYSLYGLIDEDLIYRGDDLPGIRLGERSFEIALARAVRATRRKQPGLHGMALRQLRRSRRIGRRLTGNWCSDGSMSSPPIRRFGCWRTGVQASLGAGAVGEAAGAALRTWLLTGWKTGGSGSMFRGVRCRAASPSLPTM